MSHSDLLLWGPHSWPTVPAIAAPPDLPSHLWQDHHSPELLPANYSQDTDTEPFLWEVGLLRQVNLTHTPTITLAKIFSELHCHVRVFLLLLLLIPSHSPSQTRSALWSEVSPASSPLFFTVIFLNKSFACLITPGHLLLEKAELMHLV